MIIHTVWQKSFGFFGSKPIVVESSAGQLSSDAGLLPIREFDQQVGLTEQFAQALGDRRRQRSVDHPFLQMVRMRGIRPSAHWGQTGLALNGEFRVQV